MVLKENSLAAKSGDLRWCDDGKQAGRTIMRLRGEISKYRKALAEIRHGVKMDFEAWAKSIAEGALK